MRVAVLAVVAVVAICGCSSLPESRDGNEDAEFASFLEAFETAQEAFINGDPAAWKANASQGIDATIFGGFGGFEKGWGQVGDRYDWAASQFRASGATEVIEYLSTGVSGSLAYSVAIERSRVRIGNASDAGELALRVTQIFRKENGSWKLLHRHADPMLERKAPGS